MLRKACIVFTCIVFCASCSSKVDQKKFENLYRAAKAIEGAVAVGVNYQKFGELLQNLATEISIASDKAKFEKEKELLKSYLEVLTTYQESSTVWKHKIESARYDWIPSGQIYVEPELLPIVAKYSLATESHVIQITGHKFETISASAVQVIWGKAHEQLEKATALYYGK